MNTGTRILLICLAALSAACADDNTGTAPDMTSTLRVVNGTSTSVDVMVDGQMVLRGMPVAGVSSRLGIAAGAHELRFQNALGASTLAIQSSAGGTVTAAVVAGSGVPLMARALADTGALVPAGKSKLKVVHLAQGAGAIEIWRTQPDYQTPVHIMTPFDYAAESPYLQSDAGAWEVFVTRPGSTTKLATTGAINVPGGERRTVVVLDSAGVVRLTVLEN